MACLNTDKNMLTRVVFALISNKDFLFVFACFISVGDFTTVELQKKEMFLSNNKQRELKLRHEILKNR